MPPEAVINQVADLVNDTLLVLSGPAYKSLQLPMQTLMVDLVQVTPQLHSLSEVTFRGEGALPFKYERVVGLFALLIDLALCLMSKRDFDTSHFFSKSKNSQNEKSEYGDQNFEKYKSACNTFIGAHIRLLENSKGMFSSAFHLSTIAGIEQILEGLNGYCLQKRSPLNLKVTMGRIIYEYGDEGRGLIKAFCADLSALKLVSPSRKKSLQNILSARTLSSAKTKRDYSEMDDVLFLDTLWGKVELLKSFIESDEKRYPRELIEE